MLHNNPDNEWEKFGKTDPYFGVISHEKFRSVNLTDDLKEEFFKSGFDYIEHVLHKIKIHIDPAFSIKRALDFGCGVGRLVIPLSTVADEVTGLDISDSMLNEAQNNCNLRGVKNVVLRRSDDSLSLLSGKYDLIHTYIVFQHIPAKRGERIFTKLIEHLAENGICVAQFTYAKDLKRNQLIALAKQYVPMLSNCIDLLKGRGFFAPQMQMNSYDINHLLLAIQKANVVDFYSEFTKHGGDLGVCIYFKKPSS